MTAREILEDPQWPFQKMVWFYQSDFSIIICWTLFLCVLTHDIAPLCPMDFETWTHHCRLTTLPSPETKPTKRNLAFSITIWSFNIAMENHLFVIGTPSINGPFYAIFHGYVKQPEGTSYWCLHRNPIPSGLATPWYNGSHTFKPQLHITFIPINPVIFSIHIPLDHPFFNG